MYIKGSAELFWLYIDVSLMLIANPSTSIGLLVKENYLYLNVIICCMSLLKEMDIEIHEAKKERDYISSVNLPPSFLSHLYILIYN